MDTKVVIMSETAIEADDPGQKLTDMTAAEKTYRLAGEVIRQGGLVAFPTETVYGLGGNALDPTASKKIYAAKGRPSDNPLIVHICEKSQIYDLAEQVSQDAEKLMDAFWPGPLTLILPKKQCVPAETTGGLPTVAVRMPDHEVALRLIAAAGVPIAAPSANASGRPSPTLAEHVYEDLKGKIEFILDGGPVGIGVESTIVDMTGEAPMVLRPGYISEEMLASVLQKTVSLDPAVLHGMLQETQTGDMQEDAVPKAPGMKYRHYAPKAPMYIVQGEQEAVVAYIKEAIASAKTEAIPCERIGVLCTDETAPYYRGSAAVTVSVGGKGSAQDTAHNLYACLRKLDAEEGITRIYSECFGLAETSQDVNLIEAIDNRLLKAAGGQVIVLKEIHEGQGR